MKKFQTKNYFKSKVFWIFVTFLMVLLFLFSFLYYFFVRDVTYKNIYHNISELSEQTASSLNLAINNQKKFVEIMVESIQSGFFKNEEEIFLRFRKDLESYHFTRLVILDSNGNGITSDGYSVKNYPNIEEFFQRDEVYLSENRPSTVSDSQVNIYSKTFTLNGKKLVLFATIRTEDYKEILLRRLFNGEGGTYLINHEGDILIDSYNSVTENGVNFYDYLKSQKNISHKKELEKINQMSQDISMNKVGTFDIHFSNSVYFVHFEKVNVNDWYVVTVAPDHTISSHLSLFLGVSLGFCFLLNFAIVVFFLYIFKLNRQQQEKLYSIAYIDPVTSLGNFTYFKENTILNSNKDRYVLSIDINRFKAFNKIYDYEFCNSILKTFGEILEQVSPKDSVICRVSNDIFAVSFASNLDISHLMNRLFQKASSIPLDIGDMTLTVSVGIYKMNTFETNIHEVFDKATLARLQIKGFYDNNYFVFDEMLESQIQEEQDIESSMKYALENFEFKVFYQPKVSAKQEKIVGAEALVRWYHNGKVVSPLKFIPVFEKNKFIRKLDLYVFEMVCKDMEEWMKKCSFVPLISVNVSKEHFVDEKFIDQYVEISNKYHILPEMIELEITESATIDSKINIVKIIKYIKKKGFVVSLDDFGTGYSSLSMLQDMPIDIIKIDKSFVDSANLKSMKNIINYIVLIAEQLGVSITVEGVETKEQALYVSKIGCDTIQGFYYSKPIKKSDFENYMEKHK